LLRIKTSGEIDFIASAFFNLFRLYPRHAGTTPTPFDDISLGMTQITAKWGGPIEWLL
jgi:hypothetical protein